MSEIFYHVNVPNLPEKKTYTIGEILGDFSKFNHFFNYYNNYPVTPNPRIRIPIDGKWQEVFFSDLLELIREGKFKSYQPAQLLKDVAKIVLSHRHEYGSYIRETTLEAVRKEYYPTRPSRLSSLFLCETSDQLKYWIDALTKKHQQFQILKVEVVNKRAIFYGNNEIINQIALPPTHDKLIEIAHQYWGNEKIKGPPIEILLEGTVRVLTATSKEEFEEATQTAL